METKDITEQNNTRPKISVIVPAFNVESYIEECLSSLVKQTLNDIEIIVIDDGSTDKTEQIITKYATEDKRIISLKQQNKGPSAARNVGMEIARGEYILFVDSDDWIDDNYIEKLYNSITRNNCDIAVSTVQREHFHRKVQNLKYNEEKVYENLEDKITTCNIPKCCYACAKLYKKDLIKDLKFKEGSFFEDILWLPEIIKNSDKIVTTPNVIYHYVVNNNSIVKRTNQKKQKDLYEAKKFIRDFFEENDLKLAKKYKSITKKSFKLCKIPILKIKENGNSEKYLLFGLIPIFKKALNYNVKIEGNTFLIWEPCSLSHSEVVPGYAKYLLDMGYEVSVLVNPKHIKDGLFSRFKNEKLFINKISRGNAKKFFKETPLTNIKGVLVTTAGKICDNIHFEQSYEHFSPDFDKSKLFLVEHDARFAIDQGLWNEDLITLRKLNYKGFQSTIVNPHYFGSVEITPKNDMTNFIMIGSLSSKKITQNVIINAFSELVNKGYSNFKLTVIGKGSLKHVPKEIRKFIDLKGRLPFNKMYDELEKADFILTSYNPDNPMHVFYNTTGTSGSFQLVYGFLKPCIILEEFAGVNDFNNDNAILYEKDSDYANALIHGINMSKEDYKKMQNNLKTYADNLYKLSLDNFRNIIERKENG